MKEIVVKISVDGKDLKLLYFDDAPVLDLGSYSITRASHVRFDEADQKWYVHVINPNGTEKRLDLGFVRRADAIDFEIEHLQASLMHDPSFADAMFPQAAKGRMALPGGGA